MMLYCDTREKKNAHILAYFDKHNIEYEICKLDVGDYALEGGMISVDTKRSIDELASNMLNPRDHARFWREVRRSKEQGIRLVVLIESNIYKAIPDLATWRSKYSPYTGRALMDAIYRCHISYGVDFLFAPKVSTGRRILEILSCNSSSDGV